MICIIGAVLLSIGVILDSNAYLGEIMAILGIGLVLMPLLIGTKPKYKERKLMCEFKLLPIAENIYAIKTYNKKIICKYPDEYDEINIDIISSYWIDVNEVETADEASIKYYERKAKFTFATVPFMPPRIEITINVPKGTIIS